MVWVVVNTHSNKERFADENLKRQGFRTYCPMLRKVRRHARRAEEVTRPLFPGYLFLKLDPKQERWRAIQSTFGVRSLVTFGSRLGTIPQSFIESLLTCEESGFVRDREAPEAFAAGDQVRINGGAFDEVVATVLLADAKDRLVVLFDFMRRRVRITLSPDQVARA